MYKKIILSRKGFDDQYGGKPSIIWPKDRSMFSFPIPIDNEKEKGVSSKDISYEGKKLHQIFKELGFAEIKRKFHLDPDIQSSISKRTYGAFGQNGAASGHLKNNDINKDDIFLFFGTFSETFQSEDNKLIYKPMHPFHAIWGYLVVDKVIEDICKIPKSKYHDLIDHPHYLNKDHPSYKIGNVIYVGKKYGTFFFDEILRLTKLGYKKILLVFASSLYGERNKL